MVHFVLRIIKSSIVLAITRQVSSASSQKIIRGSSPTLKSIQN
nr:MAG TPA: hypothetical protein [Caudoviricetes sp.]